MVLVDEPQVSVIEVLVAREGARWTTAQRVFEVCVVGNDELVRKVGVEDGCTQSALAGLATESPVGCAFLSYIRPQR